jgi:hypothetical protein
MSRIIWPSIAATCIALYFISRKRKVELELEIEPAHGEAEKESSSLAETAPVAD